MDRLSYDLKNQYLILSEENNIEIVAIDIQAGMVIHQTNVGRNHRQPFIDRTTNDFWQSNLFCMKFRFLN